MNRQLNEFMGVSDTQTINYNKDITMSDIEGNQKVILKCYCTIIAFKSISYYVDVIEPTIFEKYTEVIQKEMDKFRADSIRIAKEHNVPVI